MRIWAISCFTEGVDLNNNPHIVCDFWIWDKNLHECCNRVKRDKFVIFLVHSYYDGMNHRMIKGNGSSEEKQPSTLYIIWILKIAYLQRVIKQQYPNFPKLWWRMSWISFLHQIFRDNCLRNNSRCHYKYWDELLNVKFLSVCGWVVLCC